jgi:hypothetical protein
LRDENSAEIQTVNPFKVNSKQFKCDSVVDYVLDTSVCMFPLSLSAPINL